MIDQITRDRVAALARCTFLPGSWDKRFVQGVWGLEELTPAQVANVDRLSWKYRRQMPARLIPSSNPGSAYALAANSLRAR